MSIAAASTTYRNIVHCVTKNSRFADDPSTARKRLSVFFHVMLFANAMTTDRTKYIVKRMFVAGAGCDVASATSSSSSYNSSASSSYSSNRPRTRQQLYCYYDDHDCRHRYDVDRFGNHNVVLMCLIQARSARLMNALAIASTAPLHP